MVIGHDLNNCWKLRVFWLQKRSSSPGEDSASSGEINRTSLTQNYRAMLNWRMHEAHAQSFHQQVCHKEICRTVGAGRNKSSLHTLLLRGHLHHWLDEASWFWTRHIHLILECILAHWRELGSMVYCLASGRIPGSTQPELECVLR